MQKKKVFKRNSKHVIFDSALFSSLLPFAIWYWLVAYKFSAWAAFSLEFAFLHVLQWNC